MTPFRTYPGSKVLPKEAPGNSKCFPKALEENQEAAASSPGIVVSAPKGRNSAFRAQAGGHHEDLGPHLGAKMDPKKEPK